MWLNPICKSITFPLKCRYLSFITPNTKQNQNEKVIGLPISMLLVLFGRNSSFPALYLCSILIQSNNTVDFPFLFQSQGWCPKPLYCLQGPADALTSMVGSCPWTGTSVAMQCCLWVNEAFSEAGYLLQRIPHVLLPFRCNLLPSEVTGSWCVKVSPG